MGIHGQLPCSLELSAEHKALLNALKWAPVDQTVLCGGACNATELIEAAASGDLVSRLKLHRFDRFFTYRKSLEHLLSLHTARGPHALMLGGWSNLMLPLMRDLLYTPVCLLLVDSPDEAQTVISQVVC